MIAGSACPCWIQRLFTFETYAERALPAMVFDMELGFDVVPWLSLHSTRPQRNAALTSKQAQGLRTHTAAKNPSVWCTCGHRRK